MQITSTIIYIKACVTYSRHTVELTWLDTGFVGFINEYCGNIAFANCDIAFLLFIYS